MANFSDKIDSVLPVADMLELAKSYHEKKAKPLFAKIVIVLCAFYHGYFGLKSQLSCLQTRYEYEVGKNASLSSRIRDLYQENGNLSEQIRDYECVKKDYGPDPVAATVQAVKEQEQAQHSRKRQK